MKRGGLFLKRIIVLVLVFMFALQITAFAEIRKSLGDTFTNIDSYYQVYKNEPGDKSCIFSATVYVSRTFATSWSNESRYLMLWAPTTSNQADTVVFSRKNSPKIEAVKKGQSSNIIFDKIQYLSDDTMWLAIKRDSLKEAYDADKVYIVFPTKGNGIKKFEIPKEIVAEWETVLSMDMKKLRNEMLNR